MQKNRLLSDISDEELISLIDKDNSQNNEYRNDVLEFLSAHGFRQGSERIKKSIISDLYKEWSQNPISGHALGLELSRCFECSGNYYHIDKTSISLLNKLFEKKRSSRKIASKKWKQHFENYLKHYNITPGTFFVKNEVLYNLYDKWTYKNGNKNPLGSDQFLSFCTIHFKVKVARHYHWFGVNRSIFDHLDEELINELLKKKVNKNAKTKKDPKISN